MLAEVWDLADPVYLAAAQAFAAARVFEAPAPEIQGLDAERGVFASSGIALSAETIGAVLCDADALALAVAGAVTGVAGCRRGGG